MMRRLLLALLWFSPALALAQAPARVTFVANNLTMGAGSATLPNGSKLCVLATDAQDRPAGYGIGGGGQTSGGAGMGECHTVVNGAVAPFSVLNSGTSSPLNACLRVTELGPTGAEIRRDRCVQTGTAAALATWCSTAGGAITCNYDNYPLSTSPAAVTLVGPIGQQGPPGCVMGSTCTASLVPKSVNGLLYAEAFAGSDISAKISAALTSLGGTAAHPVPRAVVQLAPGQVYTTSPITIPNAVTPPYVTQVDLYCAGSTLSPTSSGSPLIHALASNNNGGNSSGSVHGCMLITPGSAPAIQQDSRQAFDIYDNHFYGGTDQLVINNSVFQDGSQGYNEQHRVHHNDFDNPGNSGVRFELNGGTDSAEYGDIEATNHFQLGCGAAAIQVDSGINIQGGTLSGKINTSQAGCTSSNPVLAIRNNGSIYRNTAGRWVGEDTVGAGAFYLFGGSGDATLVDVGITATGMSLKASNSAFGHTTLPSGSYTSIFGPDTCAKVDDEGHGPGFVISRKAIFAICQQSVRFFTGAENGSSEMAHYYFSGNTPESASSVRSIWKSDGNGVAFGPGHSHTKADGTCPDSAGCNEPIDVVETPSDTLHYVGAVAQLRRHIDSGDQNVYEDITNPNATSGQPSNWFWARGYDSSGVGVNVTATRYKARFEANHWNIYQNGNYDAQSYSVQGTPGWSGSCPSGKTLTIVNGLITNCS